jgi:hypothetical protein
MNWGALDYTDPKTQMKMIKQYEDVIATDYVAESDTKLVWVADLLMWSTRHCAENFDRPDFDVLACGRDKVLSADDISSTCKATWTDNTMGLREKIFSDLDDPVCHPYEGGICRPGDRMHPLDLVDLGLDPALAAEYSDRSFCPTADWSDVLFQFCMLEWRNTTDFGGGRFILEDERGSPTECHGDFNNDEKLQWPMPFSSGPTMFAFDLYSHEDTLEMMKQTRTLCDDDEDVHCWLTGIPYDVSDLIVLEREKKVASPNPHSLILCLVLEPV